MSRWQRALARITGEPTVRLPGSDVLERAYGLGIDAADRQFAFNGRQYFGIPSTMGTNTERVEPGFLGTAIGGMKGNSVIFSCMRSRFAVFSQARFQFRRMRNGKPGDLFGTADLSILEEPWPNGTTSDLLARMIIDADLAGNSYWTIRNGYLRRLRPDWVYIVRGVPGQPSESIDSVESTVLGYIYYPGGFGQVDIPEVFMPEEICHFAPIPDPEASYKGMSWITPILRELNADTAATEHKLKFFENGATLSYVIKYDPTLNVDDVRGMKQIFDETHGGINNAYKITHIGGGADISTVGADLRQLDFKQVQGAGETRIAAAAGVPPIIVGLSEGLQAATYSNYIQAKHHFAETTLYYLWQNVCASLAAIINVPGGSELWFDDSGIPFLRDDKLEAAQIGQTDASTMQTLINAGFTPESVQNAMLSNRDWSLLEHTGLYSVQLQPPTTIEDVKAAQSAANGQTAESGAPDVGHPPDTSVPGKAQPPSKQSTGSRKPVASGKAS